MSLIDDIYKAATTPEAAGVLGSLISLRWTPGDTWFLRLTGFAGGIGFAMFIAPLLIEYMEIKSQKGPLAFAFIGGLIGMNLLVKTVEFIRDIDSQSLMSIVFKRRDERRDQ